MAKKCTKCKETKQNYDFSVNNARMDGLQSICRLCKSKERLNWETDKRGSKNIKKMNILKSKIKENIPLLSASKITIDELSKSLGYSKQTVLKHFKEIQADKFQGEKFETMFSKFESGEASILDISVAINKSVQSVSKRITEIYELRKSPKIETVAVAMIKEYKKTTIEDFKRMQRENYLINHDPTVGDWDKLTAEEKEKYK